MKRSCCILALCLAAPFGFSAMAEPAADEVIPQRELRELLREEKNAFGPAGELIFGMDAAEQQKLRELYRTDRDGARKFILEKLEANRQKHQEAEQEIRKLSRLCRQSRNQTEQQELRARLRKLLAEQYEQTSAEIALRLKMQEARLAEVRRRYEERVANADKMIDARLEKMLAKQQPAKRKKAEKKQ